MKTLQFPGVAKRERSRKNFSVSLFSNSSESSSRVFIKPLSNDKLLHCQKKVGLLLPSMRKEAKRKDLMIYSWCTSRPSVMHRSLPRSAKKETSGQQNPAAGPGWGRSSQHPCTSSITPPLCTGGTGGWVSVHETPVLKVQSYSENEVLCWILNSSKEAKKLLLLLPQTLNSARKPWEPSETSAEQDTWSGREGSSLKSSTAVCHFVVCIPWTDIRGRQSD